MSILRREQDHWDRLAADDPMWVILTEPNRQGAWDAAEFFASGQREIDQALATLRHRFGVVPRSATALDFGCGIGRLTQALGAHFQSVHGIDISDRMIAIARERNRLGARVTYHQNSTDRLGMIESSSIDFVYSRIVLQHIPAAAAQEYVKEFVRVLAPDGVAYFQTMVRARRWTVRLRQRVRDAMPDLYRWARDAIHQGPRWEMNTLSADTVRQCVQKAGARLAHVVPDDSGTAEFDSSFFVVVKDERPADSARVRSV